MATGSAARAWRSTRPSSGASSASAPLNVPNRNGPPPAAWCRCRSTRRWRRRSSSVSPPISRGCGSRPAASPAASACRRGKLFAASAATSRTAARAARSAGHTPAWRSARCSRIGRAPQTSSRPAWSSGTWSWGGSTANGSRPATGTGRNGASSNGMPSWRSTSQTGSAGEPACRLPSTKQGSGPPVVAAAAAAITCAFRAWAAARPAPRSRPGSAGRSARPGARRPAQHRPRHDAAPAPGSGRGPGRRPARR